MSDHLKEKSFAIQVTYQFILFLTFSHWKIRLQWHTKQQNNLMINLAHVILKCISFLMMFRKELGYMKWNMKQSTKNKRIFILVIFFILVFPSVYAINCHLSFSVFFFHSLLGNHKFHNGLITHLWHIPNQCLFMCYNVLVETLIRKKWLSRFFFLIYNPNLCVI